ncbi:MAG: lysozyme [Thauera sp.]|nr:lysozyme [Thauera sp.]
MGAVEILPNSALHWPIIWPGVVEVARSEGCRLRAYRDIAGVWTIGWGETENVRPGDVMTQDEADRLLCARLGEFAQNVEALLARPATPHQLAAMVSLAYNVGLAGFARSSVLRAHNAGNALAAARAFGLWNKARVRGVLEEVRGLTARRAREAALYLSRDSSYHPPLDALPDAAAGAMADMPAAEPESRMAASPIAQSGAVSMATGAIAMASATSADVRAVATGLGIDPLLVVAAVALIVGAVVLWNRYRQRHEGWA